LTKKGTKPTTASISNLRRRGRRAVQYLLVFVGCVLVLDALVGEKGLLEMLKKRQEYRALEQSLTDIRAIEDLARRELGLIKPGEKLFILKDVPPTDTSRPK
jgi:cell division protein FtsB